MNSTTYQGKEKYRNKILRKLRTEKNLDTPNQTGAKFFQSPGTEKVTTEQKKFFSTANNIFNHVNTDGSEKNDNLSVASRKSKGGTPLSINIVPTIFNTNNSFSKIRDDFETRTPKVRNFTEKEISARPTFFDEMQDRIEELLPIRPSPFRKLARPEHLQNLVLIGADSR